MKKTARINGGNFSYTLKRFSRSKCVRFFVREKTLLVTAPKRVPVYWIEGVLAKQREWILRAIENAKKQTPSAPRGSYATHKEKARSLVSSRLEYWNRFYGFSFGRVSIRNQKTRWGSCSRKGNLNFSWKLAVLPAELADYVIVHELCHLQEFNHSKKFWDLVARGIPNYKELRKRLKSGSLA